VHRDLKPENLLLDYDRGIKLVDFGLSNTYKQGELLKTACGSPCYAAPEMIAGKKYHGTNVDIWSCGVILFALICGYLPFEDPNTSQLYKKILNADFQLPKFVSEDAKDLITKILNTDPEKRYKIEDIRKHPWFNLVKCEENFRGTIVGIDQVPIDPEILKVLNDYSIDIEYAKKCLEANKHNSITATYYLLLKKHLKQGGDSIADPRSPKYNPNYFFRRQPGFTKLATAIPVEDTTQTPT
jgi:5'-AMP-activated protein kinase catalytic alpha subunit